MRRILASTAKALVFFFVVGLAKFLVDALNLPLSLHFLGSTIAEIISGAVVMDWFTLRSDSLNGPLN